MKSKYCKVLGHQRISENNHRTSMPMEGSDLGDRCLFFKSGKRRRSWRAVGRKTLRYGCVAMFRMEMDIDFRVRRTTETRRSLGKARRCLRGSLSRAERNGSNDENGRSEGIKATGWSPSTFVVPHVKFCRVLRNSVKEIFRSRFKWSDRYCFFEQGKPSGNSSVFLSYPSRLFTASLCFSRVFKAYRDTKRMEVLTRK